MFCKGWRHPFYSNAIMIQEYISSANYLFKIYYTILYKCLEECLCNKSKAKINSWHLAVLSEENKEGMIFLDIKMDAQNLLHLLLHRQRYFLCWQEEKLVICFFALFDCLTFPNVTSCLPCNLQGPSRDKIAPVVEARWPLLFFPVSKV